MPDNIDYFALAFRLVWVALLVLLGLFYRNDRAHIRAEIGHVVKKDTEQDERIVVLERQTFTLSGQQQAIRTEISSVKQVVEHNHSEVLDRLKDSDKRNQDDHREIKELIRNGPSRRT